MGNITTRTKSILFKNTGKYIIEEGSLSGPNNLPLALTMNKKLEGYGMTLDASSLRMLSTQTAEEMARTWKEMEEILRENINDFDGPLFYPNFPEEVMSLSMSQLYLNSLFYYSFAQTNDAASLAIADELRNRMIEEKKDRLPLFEQFPRNLKIVNKGTVDDLFKMMNARMHSLNMSEQQFEELKYFSRTYKNEFDTMLQSNESFQSKETKVKIAKMLYEDGRAAELKMLLKDSIDVLRFAAVLSKKHGIVQNAVELKSNVPGMNIAFKLNNKEKCAIRSLLNNCDGLYTDIWKQEKLFKALMNRLGTKEKDGCSARLAKAFDNLAQGKKLDEKDRPIYNPNKLIKEAIHTLNTTGDAIKLYNLAQNRPGDFLRMYISTVEQVRPEYRGHAINAVSYVARSNSIPLKNLLTVREQLTLNEKAKELNQQGTPMAKVYKHHGKHFSTEYKITKLSDSEIKKMKNELFDAATRMVDGYQDLGKVYIDPELKNIKAPGREMRDASGGSVLTPYSKIDMNKDKNVLMLGLQWSGSPNTHLDVDLSAHMYDKDYNSVGFVAWSALRNYAAVHSGDYTHVGKSGSAIEAIAIDKNMLKNNDNVKYVVAEAHCYSMKSFKELETCKFVYEQKEGDLYSQKEFINKTGDGKVSFLGQVFEPSQLENCISLNSNGSTTVPFVYDIEENRVYWLDMTINRNLCQNITNNNYIMKSIIQEIEIAKNNPYPDMKTLFECYASRNGEIVSEIKEADTVFIKDHVDREELGIKESARVITSFDLDVISQEFSGNSKQEIAAVESKQEIEKTSKQNEPVLLKQLKYLQGKLEQEQHEIEFKNDHAFER